MDAPPDPRVVAVQAEALYLVNLLLMPGLAFLLLLWLNRRHAGSDNRLTRCHLSQTVAASIWAGLLLLAIPGAVVSFVGLERPATWVVLVLYFVCCHAGMVLLGVLGLSRAIAGQVFVYPLFGEREC